MLDKYVHFILVRHGELPLPAADGSRRTQYVHTAHGLVSSGYVNHRLTGVTYLVRYPHFLQEGHVSKDGRFLFRSYSVAIVRSVGYSECLLDVYQPVVH